MITAGQALNYVNSLWNHDLSSADLPPVLTIDEYLERSKAVIDYLERQLRKSQPLTDEERKQLEENSTTFKTEGIQSGGGYYNTTFINAFKSIIIYGIGHTRAEAERDAYEQWKESAK